MTSMVEAKRKWDEQIAAMVATGYWKNPRTADEYFTRWLAPLWQERLDVESDASVIEILGLTPTCLQILHVFARGYQRVSATSKTPKFRCWPPMKDGDTVRYLHAIPKRDLARLTGRSLSAIEEALGRLRGKGKGSSETFRRRIASVLAVPSGVMVDSMTTQQTCFGFMAEDYDNAAKYAHEQRATSGDTWSKQMEWSREAKAEGLGIKPLARPMQLPDISPLPVDESAAKSPAE